MTRAVKWLMARRSIAAVICGGACALAIRQHQSFPAALFAAGSAWSALSVMFVLWCEWWSMRHGVVHQVETGPTGPPI